MSSCPPSVNPSILNLIFDGLMVWWSVIWYLPWRVSTPMHIWKELPLISSLFNGTQIFVVFYADLPAIKDLLENREKWRLGRGKTDGDIGETDSLMSSLTLVENIVTICLFIYLGKIIQVKSSDLCTSFSTWAPVTFVPPLHPFPCMNQNMKYSVWPMGLF